MFSQEIVNTSSSMAIIDITGVPTVDTLVARHLLKTVSAARLMGAECIIRGIRPQIAQAMAQVMLERLGWEVMTACDGIEAVEIFQQHHDRIRCLLLDLSMPSMGGWETLSAVRAIRPDIPVVLASGYDEARVMAGDHLERPHAFLSKPYEMAQLKAALMMHDE